MRKWLGLAFALGVVVIGGQALGQRYLSGIIWPQPKVVTPGEGTAAPIWREPSDALVRNLLRAPIAGDCEQPIAPGRHKYRRLRHGSPSSPNQRFFRKVSVAELIRSPGHSNSLKIGDNLRPLCPSLGNGCQAERCPTFCH